MCNELVVNYLLFLVAYGANAPFLYIFINLNQFL